MNDAIELSRMRDTDFTAAVDAQSGQRSSTCYQCGNCTAGCPAGFVYDLQVNQVMRGVQLAGLYNVAGQVRGVQIGIVNVAESSDWTLGLVNIVKDGVMTLGLQYDAAGSALLAFRSGGRHLYGILGAGYNHRIGGAVAEAGIGVRIPCTRWLDLRQEVTASSLYDAEGQAAWGADYLFAPAFRIGQHLALTIGAGVGYQSFYPTHQPVASPFPLWQGDDGRQVSLNLQAGVEYVF